MGGTESGVTLHRDTLGQWQVVTKCGGTLANDLGRFVGPTPWGPWTWRPLLNVCDLGCYLAGAATIPTTSGALIVGHSRTDVLPLWFEVSSHG
jgi:hypothetical protein